MVLGGEMMNKFNKFNKYLYTIVFSMITVLVFLIDFKAYEPIYLTSDVAHVNFLAEIYFSISGFDIIHVILWLFIAYCYYNIYFCSEKYDKKRSIVYIVLSLFFTILTIVSKSYSIDNTLNTLYSSNAQILKTFIYFVGFYLMYYAIIKMFVTFRLDGNVFKKKTLILKEINDHPVRTSIILIGLLWLPYIILSFPGISNGDTVDQLGQFFHTEDTWSIKSINLLNKDVYINKHHSVLHTVVMGTIFKLGRDLGSFTYGAGLYTIFQVMLLLVILSFMIKYMRKINVNSFIILFSVLFIGLNPIVATYAVTAVKDTPNAIFTLLYVIFLLEIVRNFDSVYKHKFRIIVFLVVILLILMLRNNGIFVILLSFPWLFLIYKKSWKKLLLTLFIPIIVFGLYDKVLLPSFDVSNGSIREVLSIPVMQVARVVRDKEEAFSDEDIEIINKVFDFETMKREYDPNISDGIKEKYNKNATDEDLKLFFGLWFKYLKKYPLIYVESFVNSTYGYFFPRQNKDEMFMFDYFFPKNNYFDIESLCDFGTVRKPVNTLLEIYYRLPFFMNKVAYYDWVLIFSCFYIINKKKYRYLIPLSPLLSVLLVCLASPLNSSLRYILPIVFSFPIILVIDYLVYKECKK